MKKKLLFYNFIAILFITSNNIFLCCCDCNLLLYCTYFFNKYKRIIPEQWNENEVLNIKINGEDYPVSQRIKIEETQVKFKHLVEFLDNSTRDEEIEKYPFEQILENQRKLENDSNGDEDYISIFIVKNRLDEDFMNLKKTDHKLFISKGREYIVGQKIKDYYSKVDYFLKIDDIPCLFFRKKNSDDEEKNLIIFFHGNGESIFKIYDLYLKANVFSEGYDLLIPELPGYPKNKEGDFSEGIREEYIENILKFCKTYYRNKRIVIIGHSLGCHFATLLVSKDKENLVKKLIIACPFFTDKTAAKYIGKQNTSCCCECCGECLSECIVTPIYRGKLSNEENIKNVKCDIDILYATNDKVISPKDAESLFNIFKDQKDYDIDENQDVLEKKDSSQKIRLRPILPGYFTNEEKKDLDDAILKRINSVKNINELNSFFLKKERNWGVGHIDVLLYNQIKYYILN